MQERLSAPAAVAAQYRSEMRSWFSTSCSHIPHRRCSATSIVSGAGWVTGRDNCVLIRVDLTAPQQVGTKRTLRIRHPDTDPMHDMDPDPLTVHATGGAKPFRDRPRDTTTAPEFNATRRKELRFHAVISCASLGSV
jgi:hypothetical protein